VTQVSCGLSYLSCHADSNVKELNEAQIMDFCNVDSRKLWPLVSK